MEIDRPELLERLKYRFQSKILKAFRYNSDGLETATTSEQKKVEDKVTAKYLLANEALKCNINTVKLDHAKHVEYLRSGLFGALGTPQALDASRAWVIYWDLHALYLLKSDKLSEEERKNIIATLSSFQHADGGFGGGPKQQPHLAPTYAAVNSLVSLKGYDSFDAINVQTLKKFLLSLKQPDGSYALHQLGEVDVRGIYCAISVASLCGLLPDEELTRNTVQWILSCQTYEGGFGGKPGCEAHGGYTFCAIATLTLLGQLQRCNLKSLLRWSVNRQLSMEGGFSGRTNKLVDVCYSFWCGALLPIIQAHLATISESSDALPQEKWLFNQAALQEYILCCCQSTTGGFIDKPGKNADFYHTCYALSGLSIAQNSPKVFTIPDSVDSPLPLVHPIFNIEADAVEMAQKYFTSK